MIVAALGAAGCATGEVEFEGGAPDGMAPVEENAPVEETAEDASMPPPDNNTPPADTGSVDMDSGVVDTGVIDTGVVDTGVIDTGVIDTGVIDTGVIDTGPRDTGVIDTGVIDTGPRDTGVVDTGPVDTGPPPDTGLVCMAVIERVTCTGRYNCCFALGGIPAGCGCQVPILGCVPQGGPGCPSP